MSDWRANMAAALAAGGVRSQTQWVAKFPGVHCWFEFRGIDSCASCGVCRAFNESKQRPCRGIVKIELR